MPIIPTADDAYPAALLASSLLHLPKPRLVRLGDAAVYRAGDVVLRVQGPQSVQAPVVAWAHQQASLTPAFYPLNTPYAPPVDVPPYTVTSWHYCSAARDPQPSDYASALTRLWALPPSLPSSGWDLSSSAAGQRLFDLANRSILNVETVALFRFELAHLASALSNAPLTHVTHGDPLGNLIVADHPVFVDLDTLGVSTPERDLGGFHACVTRYGFDPAFYTTAVEAAHTCIDRVDEELIDLWSRRALLSNTLWCLDLASQARFELMDEAHKRLHWWQDGRPHDAISWDLI